MSMVYYELNENTEITDENNPPLNEQELQYFRKASEIKSQNRKKLPIDVWLDPNTIKKLESLDEDYKEILGNIIEHIVEDDELFNKYL